MKIKQKYRGNETEFEFEDSILVYSFKDSHQRHKFGVPYLQICLDEELFLEERNPFLKYLSIPFLVVGLVAFIAPIATSGESQKAGLIVASFWFLVGVIPYIMYLRSTVAQTIYNTLRGNIIVIHDGREKEIIDTLQKIQSLKIIEADEGLETNRDQDVH